MGFQHYNIYWISRLNKAPPNIVFKKKEKGGLNLQTMVQQSELDTDLVKTILSEYRLVIQYTIADYNLEFNSFQRY